MSSTIVNVETVTFDVGVTNAIGLEVSTDAFPIEVQQAGQLALELVSATQVAVSSIPPPTEGLGYLVILSTGGIVYTTAGALVIKGEA